MVAIVTVIVVVLDSGSTVIGIMVAQIVITRDMLVLSESEIFGNTVSSSSFCLNFKIEIISNFKISKVRILTEDKGNTFKIVIG